ncbi:MAG: hypothetical protein RBT39_16680, partial [Azoarcus sp.]|nr:hypothetical protein [Azoarcus sp.]
DARYAFKSTARKAKDYSSERAGRVAEVTKELADKSGANDLVQRARETILGPAKDVIRKSGVEQSVNKKLSQFERAYGYTREIIKPYFAPEDSRELLTNARRELANVSACIMQISGSDSERLASQFGSAVLAKATGAAATGSLLALVAAYGTAGTGTAIASLSGAAAANATLAWVGGLLGGGMAAGAVLTGGIGLVAGLAAYKLLGSERRTFESLSDTEQRLVQTSWLAIAIIDEYLASPPGQFTEREAEQLLVNVFRPLLEDLRGHQNEICLNLDGKHALALRQHILTDFRRVVIESFDDFIAGYPLKGFAGSEYVIAGVFCALLSRSAIAADVESQLVLDAVRRSSNRFEYASENEIGEYLRELSPESLKGYAANVKGIYHELLFVHNYNTVHSDTRAEVFGATNHPGADIQIRDVESGEIIEQIQLKAVMDVAKLEAHLDRYPDISVLATNEVADQFADARVDRSGYGNETLQSKVDEDLAAFTDSNIGDRAGDAALLALGIASARELLEIVEGKRDFPDSAAKVLQGMGVAATTTALTAYLFS